MFVQSDVDKLINEPMLCDLERNICSEEKWIAMSTGMVLNYSVILTLEIAFKSLKIYARTAAAMDLED